MSYHIDPNRFLLYTARRVVKQATEACSTSENYGELTATILGLMTLLNTSIECVEAELNKGISEGEIVP